MSRTTLVVTKVTDSVSLNPAGTHTCTPSPHQIPSGTGPVVKHKRGTVGLPSSKDEETPH